MKKIFCAAALALSLAIPLAACRGAALSAASPAALSGVTEAAQSAGGFTFTDSLGRTVTLAAPPQRVAAMLGSYADIWLLAGGELAAATQDAWDEGIVTGEETVNVGSHQQPNAESLLAAAPDFVLLTPDIDTQLALRDTLEAAGVPCAYLHVDSLEEYLAALKLCTDLTGRADLYEENGEAVRGRVEETIASVQGKEAPDVLLLRAFSSGVKAKGADNFVGAMLADALSRLPDAGYEPYYLYRQKYMAGGFENVGWTKPGHESPYNICIMEELCSIISMGAGGSTKLVAPGKIKRVFAPKYPLEYINGAASVRAGKERITDFYGL